MSGNFNLNQVVNLKKKLFAAEQVILPGIINTFVHIIMYWYYFLASLGPQMQKFLWWKIYVTKLQMVNGLYFFQVHLL